MLSLLHIICQLFDAGRESMSLLRQSSLKFFRLLCRVSDRGAQNMRAIWKILKRQKCLRSSRAVQKTLEKNEISQKPPNFLVHDNGTF